MEKLGGMFDRQTGGILLSRNRDWTFFTSERIIFSTVGNDPGPDKGDGKMTTLSYERNGKVYSTEVETLPPTAIAYLLQYGFSQSLQDSIAGRAKAVVEELLPPIAERKPGFVVPTQEQIDAVVAEDIEGQLNKRLDAIKAGNVATRGTSVARDPAAGIVRELLVAWAKAKGGKLPKADSDEYKALADKMRAAKADWIKAELARRAEVAGEIDIEL
jgi:hypothetical protein